MPLAIPSSLACHPAHRAEGAYPQEFYTALGIVAEVPAFVDRPSVQAAELAWAGRRPEAPPSDLKLPPIL